jgi:hypothetical protein
MPVLYPYYEACPNIHLDIALVQSQIEHMLILHGDNGYEMHFLDLGIVSRSVDQQG